MPVDPIPNNYPRLSPYLTVDDARAALTFYSQVFGFTQRGDVVTMPDGGIGHAELALGDSLLMLADAGAHPAATGTPRIGLTIYMTDVDAVYAQALAAGATSGRVPTDEFYGYRVADVIDPWGHLWHIMAHVEEVTPDELQRRIANLSG